MGIRNLNKLINKKCKDIIIKYKLKELENKTIVVDISIYLYKYKSYTNLFGYMYNMLMLFKKYNIYPIFIFDGKSPDEKKFLIEQRKKEKKMNEIEIKNIEKSINNYKINIDELNSKLLLLKKKVVKINKYDINNIKILFNMCNILYFDAEGEADFLCAELVKKNIAWACLSEDTDLFVYNCTRVLKNLDIINETVLLYDTSKILNKLKLNINEFRMICVVSGTDYFNNKCKNYNINYILKLYNEYKTENILDNTCHFYKWLYNKNIILEYILLFYIELIFSYENINLNKYINKLNEKKVFDINNNNAMVFLKNYNFIFIN
tara:strand:- start:1211 stop:2173 length:963 start_codon:yes stop_codon:yes gene_type:complete